MTLGEKIQYYRKKNKLSQEELAARVGCPAGGEQVGAGRRHAGGGQAVGPGRGLRRDHRRAAQPGGAERGGRVPGAETAAAPGGQRGTDGPGWLGRLARRWGWLAGVYIALSGAGITLVGALARFAFGQMFQVTVGDRFRRHGLGRERPIPRNLETTLVCPPRSSMGIGLSDHRHRDPGGGGDHHGCRGDPGAGALAKGAEKGLTNPARCL